MFIELTDHLRCPAGHDEAFLVLLPETMDGRSVKTGQLGCPVCHRTFRIQDGVLDVGGAPEPADSASSALTAEAMTVLVGLSGPGGYMALVGPVASQWREIAALNPGVALVAVNPGPDVSDASGISVLRGGSIPIKSRALRGVVLGKRYAEDRAWVREAARVVLPGLRIVGEGADPPADIIDLMASAEGAWVGTGKR